MTTAATIVWKHAQQYLKDGTLTPADVQEVIASYKTLAYTERICGAIDDLVERRAQPAKPWEVAAARLELPMEAVWWWYWMFQIGRWEDDRHWRKTHPLSFRAALPIYEERGWITVKRSKSGAILKVDITDKMPREFPSC